MGFFKSICVVIITINLAVFLAPGLPPFDIEFKEINFDRFKPTGPLELNSRLDTFEKLSTKAKGISLDKFSGPEAFAEKDNYLYTGIVGGEIIRISLDDPIHSEWEVVFKYGAKCDKIYQEVECGRPLGLRFDPQGRLVVADASYGVYRIDLEKKRAELLVPADLEVDGKKAKLANSVAIAKNGIIYYTVASTRYHLHDGVLDLLTFGSPSARLLRYDPKTNSSKVLIDQLCFANGVALTDDESFLIVSDLGRGRLLKYHLSGSKKDTFETFGQPVGMIDNLVSIKNGGFMASVILPIPEGKFTNPLVELVFLSPNLTRYLFRMITAAKATLTQLIAWFPSVEWLKVVNFYTAHFKTFSSSHGCMVVEFNKQGDIVQSWQSQDKISGISEANPIKGYLYLGSPTNDFAARVKI